MRSRSERTVLTVIALVLVAAAGAAWWTRDAWLPYAGPWSQQMWKKATRPGADSVPPDHRTAAQAAQAAKAAQTQQPRGAASQAAPPQPRKCVVGARITYTDQACPAGSQELAVEGDVTSLPAR